jgi:hypothetical protein
MAAIALDYLPRPIRRFARTRERNAWKGLLAGALGGLAGTIVMTQFQNAWRKAAEKSGFGSDGQEKPEARAQQQRESEQSEDATMKFAGKMARAAGKELTREQRGTASPFIHYGFGTAMGALYGMAMESSPQRVRSQKIPYFGSVFGSVLFLGADEVAIPAAGLGEAASSPTKHLYAWVSHLVYGLTTEFVRREVRARL